MHKDDDIITQFVDANELKINIDNCTTFEQIIKVLNQHVFEVEEAGFEDKNNLGY